MIWLIISLYNNYDTIILVSKMLYYSYLLLYK